MPHPNRSFSSPGLRHPSKQALDELSFSRAKPMSRQNPSFHTSVRRLSTRRPRPSVASIADLFVSSLVVAGLCHEHSPRGRGLSTWQPGNSYHGLRRCKGREVTNGAQSPARSRLDKSGLFQPSRNRSWFAHSIESVKDDASEMHHVDFRSNTLDTSVSNPRLVQSSLEGPGDRQRMDISTESPVDTPPSLTRDQRLRITISSLFDRLFGENHGWEEAVEAILPKQTSVKTVDDSRDAVERPTVAALVGMLYADEPATTQQLFRLYRDMPSPGVAYLSKQTRGRLLRQFANPPNRRAVDARRYHALVDDMISAGLPMSRSLWSSAIHLAGRGGNGKVWERNMVHAIGIWQQMEHIAGIPADQVVFNILFDIALKGHQFTVANRLEAEMAKRGITFSRDGFVSKIYYHGMQKDVKGIRRTFDKFVESGELVDTVVLNCLMASFLRAGDLKTAREIYRQMMDAQEVARDGRSISPHIPSLSAEFTLYRAKTRELGRMLRDAKSLKKRLPESHRAIQESVPMTPDTRTFYILLRHCVHGSGDLSMFMDVLRDMEQTFPIPPRHFIYILLFEGFALHGRRKKSTWTVERLRLTWHSFIRAVRDSQRRHPDQPADQEMVWENPFVVADVDNEIPKADSPDADAPEPNTSENLYMPLLSTAETEPTLDETFTNFPSRPHSTVDLDYDPGNDRQSTRSTIQDSVHAEEAEEVADAELSPFFSDELDPGTFAKTSSGDSSQVTQLVLEDYGAGLNRQHHEYLKRRVSNGIFIGRRMVVVILRAFGTCCGSHEVMEAWLQLERFWPPTKRKALDAIAVKEVLDEQMSRPRRM
ncbi:hypothetical protein N7492_005033 [Penicillium capsulatum]|uniref:Pentatricopeptide repeat protein n=1 Tax=Penicillium capsulatum TaxID=69766 RepID=A0A9W9I8W1_9EURO|nr:hypothetical protein N7492_005033 [Penicillium capsulatum]KAJ6135858.1 hypothetical protein N7512_001018 [Penicillium capsulatum]